MDQSFNFSRLPPLKSLKGFEATARLSNASRAAEELHVTPPAITHQIQSLEQSLGIDLFQREGRKLILTEAGKVFYPYVLRALSEVNDGVKALEALSCKPEALNIQTYVTAAIRWLAPRISRFRRANPDIPVRLHSCSGWQFDAEHADVGLIFLDTPPEAKYGWKPLFPYELTPVCTPELVAGLNPPLAAEALLQLPLLSVHTEEMHWEMWLDSAGICAETLDPPLTVDTLAIALEMALNGEGVALINGPFAERELQQGMLVKPFKHSLKLGDWGVIYPRSSGKTDQIDAFISWLEVEL